MEHPGRGPLGSTSTCREDSDEAIIPFGVPSCCPFYRKPTLLLSHLAAAEDWTEVLVHDEAAL
ncbi:hypothetical protein J3E68DRAFT_432638 [Trichoderma sp. SZMC 28012]